jgi:alkylation response protein AidB-like acyl-CoA dehydrogenase
LDFKWGAAEEAYRDQARRWIEASVPAWWRRIDAPDFGEDDHFERLRAWHQQLYDAGYVGVTWPREYGGQGRGAVENAILQEELVRADAPPTVNGLGIGLCGPALMHHGSDEQKARHLRPMLRAEQIWCQGYSEPGAGSDLAGLQTRAEPKGDRYVVNGQKIWTSGAQHADWCFCLVRTDPGASDRHGGIGFLLIDMHSPGIEVRPLVQITGTRNFNQVFFADVEVPAENMVGKPTEGWRVANTVLSYERGANTLSRYVAYQRSLRDLIDLVRRMQRGGQPAAADPVARQRVAQLAIEIEILRLNSLREITRLAKGERPGSESSIQKLYRSELEHRLARFASSLQGPYAQLARRARLSIDGGRWAQRELAAFGGTIAAGTSEIQRNIISERVLGLPRR